MDKRYTNVAVLKETRAKLAPACDKLAEEMYKRTGHRVKVTLSMLLEEFALRYMNEVQNEPKRNKKDGAIVQQV